MSTCTDLICCCIPTEHIFRLFLIIGYIPLSIIVCGNEQAVKFHRRYCGRLILRIPVIGFSQSRRRSRERTNRPATRGRSGRSKRREHVCPPVLRSLTRSIRIHLRRWLRLSCQRLASSTPRGIRGIIITTCLASRHQREFCLDAFELIRQLQWTAWAGVAGCEECICSFGVGDGCFEIFDADGDMEVVFCEEIFEVFFVDGDGGVDGLFEYFCKLSA